MKRFALWSLIFAMLLGLCACGEQSVSLESEAPMPSGGERESAVEVDGYIVPTGWKEESINDGTYGYVTAGAELPDGNFQIEDGYLVSQKRDMETGETTLLRCGLDGTEINRVVLPPQAKGEHIDQSVGWYCFGENGIWLTYNVHTLLNEETGETELASTLQQWSYEGEQLLSISIEENFPLENESFVSGIALAEDETPILLADQTVFFCDSQGGVAATLELPDVGFRFCRDRDGRLYLYDTFASQLYTIDWKTHALGKAVLSTGTANESVMAGGGEYDFFLKSDARLRGVSLTTGTITEILSWEDWDLAGCVGGVGYLDPQTLLIGVNSLLNRGSGSQILTLSRVPGDQIFEKKTVRLAVGLRREQVEMGFTWTDSLDQMIVEQMNSFNRSSNTYRVEVETFSSAEELNLRLAAGDAPDIIDWATVAWLDDTPSMALYEKKGYLTDLAPLIDRDEELDRADFLPNILELMQRHTGGLYALPVSFYCVACSAPIEYVGDRTGWGFSDLLEVAKMLPEDMSVWGSCPRSEQLKEFLRPCIDNFVNINAGTCDFQNQEFYDLLTLCRDYFPAAVDENTPSSEESLLQGEATMGRLGNFVKDVMEPMGQQGRTLIGEPGTDGNAMTVVLTDTMTICSLGAEQQGAWEFVRTLFLYDFQYNGCSIMSPIRKDALEDKENEFVRRSGLCTMEESQKVRKLIYGAKTLRVNDSPLIPIVQEEAEAFFAGDKPAEAVAEIIENRVKIYLSERS